MKIIRPYMRMQTTGGVVDCSEKTYGQLDMNDPLDFVNWCGRISHRSEDAEKQNVEKFLRSVVLDHGDWSITEHVSISVDAIVDRGITHEIVRHRIAAYTQESTRFVNYQKKMPPSFVYPKPGEECEWCLNGNEALRYPDGWFHKLNNQIKCEHNRNWMNQIQSAEEAYKALLAEGWRPQEARSVFPNALSSRIVITMNLRTWRHFFLMRTSKEAHPQMRQVTIPLLFEFQSKIPVLYEDIVPEARQVDNLKLGR